MASVVMRDVCKSFGKTDVIRNVDLDIENREFVVFVGPSGCGKSTLLRLISGLEDITSGDLYFDGERVNHLPPSGRGIAMVFQSYALYPHMSVYENMAFGLKLAKHGKQGIDEKVRQAAGILQIEHLLERKPRELSGGQRQRVAIGRAIVREPQVFLFDEPLSNLDAALRVQMRIEIAKLHADLDATMVYVTHDQVEAMTLAEKIVVLNAGIVEQVGSPLELYHRPRNQFVAGFIGSPRMNFIESTTKAVEADGILIDLPGDTAIKVPVDPRKARPGDPVTLGIRPEHLALAKGEPGGTKIDGSVFVIERLGGESFLYVQLPGDAPVVAQAEGDCQCRTGEAVTLHLPAEACHLFDREGVAFSRRTDMP